VAEPSELEEQLAFRVIALRRLGLHSGTLAQATAPRQIPSSSTLLAPSELIRDSRRRSWVQSGKDGIHGGELALRRMSIAQLQQYFEGAIA